MEKRTVKKIYHMNDFTLIRAIVIGIADREKLIQHHEMLHRASNKYLLEEVFKAAHTCNL